MVDFNAAVDFSFDVEAAGDRDSSASAAREISCFVVVFASEFVGAEDGESSARAVTGNAASKVSGSFSFDVEGVIGVKLFPSTTKRKAGIIAAAGIFPDTEEGSVGDSLSWAARYKADSDAAVVFSFEAVGVPIVVAAGTAAPIAGSGLSCNVANGTANSVVAVAFSSEVEGPGVTESSVIGRKGRTGFVTAAAFSFKF